MEPPAPKHAFTILVVGAESAPQSLVFATLDRVTPRVRASHRLVLVGRGDGDQSVSEWIDRQHGQVVGMLEPAFRHDGRYAEARWAMRVASLADGVIIFGDPGRWRLLLRYAADAGVPYRVVRVPEGQGATTERRAART